MTAATNPTKTALINQAVPLYFKVFNTPLKSALLSMFVTMAVTYVISLFANINSQQAYAIGIPISFGIAYVMSHVLLYQIRIINQKNKALQELNKELEAFSRTVAHDLKNPLGAVNVYAELLNRHVQHAEQVDSEKIQSYADRIKQSSKAATDIVDALLLLASSRKEHVATQALDMRAIIDKVCLQLKHSGKPSDIAIPESLPNALGYAPWVEGIWTNYLSNAIKYGGTPPIIEIGAQLLQDGMVKYWVKDNGKGLSAEQQSQLFLEFSHLRRIQGHGLGLSIVKRVVTRLGGKVGVDSQVGQGSTFYFTLPLSTASLTDNLEQPLSIAERAIS